VLHAGFPGNETFSYQVTWPRQFQAHRRFEATLVNLGNTAVGRLAAEARVRHWSGDAVVLLHSVFSNAQLLDSRCLAAVQRLPQPKAFFIGNEYKLMPEKMRFCEELPAALLVSQSSSAAVHRLYRERLGCRVIGIPNSGLDPDLFKPCADPDARPIDLGYRAQDAPAYLGHTERRDIADYFRQHAARFGLSVDISMEASDRLGVRDWAAFLNRCKGQLGTEAGGDFFELTDATRTQVNAYVRQHPDAEFDEIWRLYFAGYQDPTPLRIISSRHIEAAGTRTAQILFEGRYDGYFEADVHYIPLRKDLSNAGEAVGKFLDRSTRRAIADRAFDLVRSELTYDRLIDRFADALEPLL
jgi:hypothetical protein